MTLCLGRLHGLRTGAVLIAFFLQSLALSTRADELADFRAAVVQASAQYQAAMTTLDTRGREETSAAVQRFRSSWQIVADKLGPDRIAAFAENDQYAAIFMQVDMRVVAALIVIDIGSREAAREALAPIQETLSQLIARSAPVPK